MPLTPGTHADPAELTSTWKGSCMSTLNVLDTRSANVTVCRDLNCTLG